MIQISVNYALNQRDANEYLRIFQKEYPKRKIISVSMVPTEPNGWFMTITYEVDI